jgi:hypothetical protein
MMKKKIFLSLILCGIVSSSPCDKINKTDDYSKNAINLYYQMHDQMWDQITVLYTQLSPDQLRCLARKMHLSSDQLLALGLHSKTDDETVDEPFACFPGDGLRC